MGVVPDQRSAASHTEDAQTRVVPPDLAGSGERRHVPALDGLRGLAIVLVTVSHFLPYRHPAGDAHAVIRYGLLAAHVGQTGVDLFFVLSGYLITGILLDTRHHPSYFRNFYGRRTLRIFPLYYGVLIFVILLPTLFSGEPRAEILGDLKLQWWLWAYLTNV